MELINLHNDPKPPDYVAIETSGVIGPKSKMFLDQLGSRMIRHTGDEHATTYLLQHLSIEIQRQLCLHHGQHLGQSD